MEQTPRERLTNLAAKIIDRAPLMVQGVLRVQFPAWANNQTDQDIINLCWTLREYLDYIETGQVPDPGHRGNPDAD